MEGELFLNAIVIAVIVMIILSLRRVHVVLSLLIGALTGGLIGGLGLEKTITTFTEGLGSSASIALSYALLGSFAACLTKTGFPNAIIYQVHKLVGKKGEDIRKSYSKIMILLIILFISCSSQNLVPIHIAFIPIFIPPMLKIFNDLQIDRRMISIIIAFGLITPYMVIPAGFGKIYHDILQTSMSNSGLVVDHTMIAKAMIVPSLGMVVGLLFALFVTYRKPRKYTNNIPDSIKTNELEFTKKGVWFAVLAIVSMLVIQLLTNSMIFGSLAGIIVLLLTKSVSLNESDETITAGMKMLSFIGFVMISAAGFSAVLRETGDIETLVETSASLIGDNHFIAALIMLLIGLLITLGIGSSFSTIPIIATIFVPLCVALGFSPLATIALIGTAGALGDAGSPASDSTLGPTSGLNADGAHNHIWDTCVPTFLHFNIPLIIFGVVAAMIL